MTSSPARDTRKTPRVSRPLHVRLNGKTYSAANWSAGGVGLHEQIPNLKIGDVVKLLLAFGTLNPGELRIVFPVTARLARISPDSGSGFQFVDLSPQQAELLHRVIDEYLAGQAPALASIILENQGAQAIRPRPSRALFQTGLRLGLALMVAAGLLTLLLPKWIDIDAPYAAVTNRFTRVIALDDGILTRLEVEPGASLHPDMALFTLVPRQNEKLRSELTTQQVRLTGLRAQQQSRLTEVQALSQAVEHSLEGESLAIDRQIEAAGTRLKLAQEQLARQQRLATHSYVDQGTVDTHKSAVAEARQTLADLQRQRADLQAPVDLSRIGIYDTEFRDNMPTVTSLKQGIATIDSELADLQERIQRLDDSTRYRSPCFCRVGTIFSEQGATVSRGHTVLALESLQPPAVEALILAEDARRLRIGDQADILLADGQERRGKVREIRYSVKRPDREGLPENLFAAERYARVLISAPIQGMHVGLTAHVILHPSWWQWPLPWQDRTHA